MTDRKPTAPRTQRCDLCGATITEPDTTCPDCGDPVCWCHPAPSPSTPETKDEHQ